MMLRHKKNIAKKKKVRRPRRVFRVLSLVVVLAIFLPLFVYSTNFFKSNINPRANFWESVRQGVSGYTSVETRGHHMLIQNAGQNWRQVRNDLLSSLSPWLLAGVLFMIGAFFVISGKDKLEEPPSGERIQRWSQAERVLHWITATLFIIMAITGLSMLFGRRVLIPVMGHDNFAAYGYYAKLIHNYSGPLFFATILIEIIAWFKYNIPKKMDFVWFKNLGGMVGSGPRPHAERINGGEKAWFWTIATIGVGVCLTGLTMDFPNVWESRTIMQIAYVIHVSLAMLFLAASFGHIYIGTVGAEGTFEGIWRGDVSAEWAKQHQNLWYDQKVSEKEGATTEDGGSGGRLSLELAHDHARDHQD
jgi:formate dehydrogenase subunit gamma